MLLSLLACTPAASDSAAKDVVEDPCAVGPGITITSPENESTFTVGETIAFTAEATSEADPPEGLLILWSVTSITDPEAGEVHDGKGTSMSFTPDVADDYAVRAQVEDSCKTPVQDSIRVKVVDP